MVVQGMTVGKVGFKVGVLVCDEGLRLGLLLGLLLGQREDGFAVDGFTVGFLVG